MSSFLKSLLLHSSVSSISMNSLRSSSLLFLGVPVLVLGPGSTLLLFLSTCNRADSLELSSCSCVVKGGDLPPRTLGRGTCTQFLEKNVSFDEPCALLPPEKQVRTCVAFVVDDCGERTDAQCCLRTPCIVHWNPANATSAHDFELFVSTTQSPSATRWFKRSVRVLEPRGSQEIGPLTAATSQLISWLIRDNRRAGVLHLDSTRRASVPKR